MAMFAYLLKNKEQHESRQIIAMKNFGIHENCIYVDNHSGKNFKRPAYKSLIEILKLFDTLVIKSIDRLGHNYEEIIEQWHVLTKENFYPGAGYAQSS